MTYYEEPGVLMDIMHFFTMDYNFETITNRSVFINHLEHYYYLKYLFASLEPVPDLLPFFYSDDVLYSFLPDVVFNLNMQSLSIETLIQHIESDEFEEQFFRHWLRNRISENRIIEIINMPINERIRLLLFNYYYNFSYYRDILIRHIKALHSFVIELRKIYNFLIKAKFDKFNDKHIIKDIFVKHNIDITEYMYSITLINSIYLKIDDQRDVVYIGVKKFDLLEGEDSSFPLFFEGETLEILNLIKFKSPISINEIYDITNMDLSFLFHQFDILLDAKLIKIYRNFDNKSYIILNEVKAFIV